MLRRIIAISFLCSSVAWGCPQSVQLPASTVSGSLLRGSTCPNDRLLFLDQEFLADDNGTFVVGLGRDIKGVVPLFRINGEQRAQVAVVEVKPREYRISIVEGVPQRTVTPDESDLARIRQESRLVAAAKSRVVEGSYWQLPAVRPAEGRISGVYGSQRVYNGTPGNPHYGLDIAAPTGTPVKSPVGGVVVLAESDLFYSGGTIIIAHGGYLTSSFLHLSTVDVAVGDMVAAGQIIGGIGATGRATGPHLDWRMNWLNQRVDTQLLLETGWPNTGAALLESKETP